MYVCVRGPRYVAHTIYGGQFIEMELLLSQRSEPSPRVPRRGPRDTVPPRTSSRICKRSTRDITFLHPRRKKKRPPSAFAAPVIPNRLLSPARAKSLIFYLISGLPRPPFYIEEEKWGGGGRGNEGGEDEGTRARRPPNSLSRSVASAYKSNGRY